VGEARNAIILTSGGVDSITTAFYVYKKLAVPKLLLLFCDYGQRTASEERYCVSRIAQIMKSGLITVDITWLGRLSTSLLTKPGVAIPETRMEELNDIEKAKKRMQWWWDPVRNALLGLVALAHAESLYLSKGERYDIYFGIRRETPVAMRDNTPEFINALNALQEHATFHGGYRFHAPLIGYDKDAVVKLGEELSVPWQFTYSCYAGGLGFTKHNGDRVPIHCGRCSNCKRRALAFLKAGVEDPTYYAVKPEVSITRAPSLRCPYCLSAFEDEKELSRHIDRVHIGSGLLEGDVRKW